MSGMLALTLTLCLAAPQSPGFEQAPTGLTVVCVDVGHGDGTVIRAPDGTVHVIDSGVENMGTSAVVPVIQSLAPTGYGVAIATHYHFCHIGGLDEVIQALPFPEVWDRGDDNFFQSSAGTAYLAAAGARRRTVTPGQVFQLGGGATLTVISTNGQIVGGTTVPVAGINGEENARSIALRLDYGQFSMWIAGDLTGGLENTPDVETPASAACGDVDVYQVNHHGADDATNDNLVANLRPDLAVFSAAQNTRGSPTTGAITRLNRLGAGLPMVCTTPGMGTLGFAVVGNLTITTDGTRYRATAQDGQFLDLFVDEVRGRQPGAGDIVLSEVMRDPAQVPDVNGEYLELTNVSTAPVSLKEVTVTTSAGSYRWAAQVMLLPGRPVLASADGYPARNGGLGLSLVWPPNSLSLGDQSETITLTRGPVTLDTLTYGAGFAGGPGAAAELTDLRNPGAANFAVATTRYGRGDLGTPARRNSTDVSAFAAALAVETDGAGLLFHSTALSHGGMIGVVGMALSTTPATTVLGATIPLAPDSLLLTSLQLPGFIAPLPAEGYRSHRIVTPAVVSGLPAFAAHTVLDPIGGTIPTVSTAVPLVFP